MKSVPASLPDPVEATVLDSWHKSPDLEVHVRRVTIAGGLTILELRDFISSTRTYGRGVWFADSPTTRALFDLILAEHGSALWPAPTPRTDIGLLPKAPAIDVAVTAIEVDGQVVCEFREIRNGQPGRGYWIPWDRRAEVISTTAAVQSAQVMGRAN